MVHLQYSHGPRPINPSRPRPLPLCLIREGIWLALKPCRQAMPDRELLSEPVFLFTGLRVLTKQAEPQAPVPRAQAVKQSIIHMCHLKSKACGIFPMMPTFHKGISFRISTCSCGNVRRQVAWSLAPYLAREQLLPPRPLHPSCRACQYINNK
jgi:hypothetical protein